MKRKTKRKPKKPQVVSGPKYYPVVMCQNEKIAIAVSKIAVKVKGKKRRRCLAKAGMGVHWQQENCQFRKGCEIDFNSFKEGDVVLCPRCNSNVDFVVFASSSVPGIGEIEDEE